MKLHRPTLRRLVAATSASLLLLGATAFADTTEVPVTLGVLRGARTLQVTGVDAGAPAGPATLAFGPNSASAPFGVVVTDLMWDRQAADYDVTATLSDLFLLDTGGAVDCATDVPSGAFSVSFGAEAIPPTGIGAVVEPLLTLATSDIVDDLDALGLDLEGSLALLGLSYPTEPVPLELDVAGALADLADLVGDTAASLTLMQVGDGPGSTFAAGAAHPDCPGSGTADPDDVLLQQGTRQEPANWDAITAQVLADASSGAVDLLPPGAAGDELVRDATRSALEQVLADLQLLDPVVDAGLLETLVDDVVEELAVTDLALDLIGQTGVYANLPTLDLDTDHAGYQDAGTGLYHGVMTVTLTSR